MQLPALFPMQSAHHVASRCAGMQGALAEVKRFWNSVSQDEQTRLLTISMEDLRAQARQLAKQAAPGKLHNIHCST